MHIGHNHEDIDHQDLAIRHLGAGIIKEQEGKFQEALEQYEAALVKDPDLQEARTKLVNLMQRTNLRESSKAAM